MRVGNWPLLLLALEHVIKHAEQYRQGTWRSDCGTFRCLAGWIAYFAGYRDVLDKPGDPKSHFYGVTAGHIPVDANGNLTICPDPILPVEDAALLALDLDQEVFGMDVDEDHRIPEMEDFANDLFAGGLDMVDILTVVRDLAKADGVTPTPLIVEEMLTAGILSKWDTF